MGKKSLIYLLVISLVVFIIVALIFWIKKPNISLSSTKTWEIILGFNSENETLSLKKITLLDKTIRPDFRGAADSPYELSVLDKKPQVLYLTKIHITEELHHSLWTGYPTASASSTPTPTVLETAIFIPYFENASKIQISKEGKVVLSFDVKPALSLLNLIPTVFAQSSSSNRPIKVVIMGDYFPTLSQFQEKASTLINALQGAAPYSGLNPSIFDFTVAPTNIGFGCTLAPGPFQGACTEANIKRMGYDILPQATKFIVLANNDLSAGPPLGLTNDIGGDVSLIGVNQPPGISFTTVAIHEFLGHAVGELYDRYALTSKPGIKYGIRSNCTDNPSGEAFWRSAGANGPYSQGCDSPSLYAPSPNDCPPPPQPPPGWQGPIITTRGSSGTIMGSCNPNVGFDAVEQAWIRTQIIPRYQPVSAPTPTPTPVAPQVTPTPQAANDCSFNLTNNQIVRGDVLTQVSATRSDSSYNLSLLLLNSRIGTFVGAINPGNSLIVSWNSRSLFQNGYVALRCTVTNASAGNVIFSRDVTINVQN